MAQTNINIRMDEDLKHEFDSLCNDLGLTMTGAFTVFAKTVVRQRGIPFDVVIDPFYSENNKARLREAIADVKAGRNMMEHELVEVDDEKTLA